MSTIIVLEGLDGTGKSTVAAALAKKLQARGSSAVLAREPGFTEVGEDIRKRYLLSHVPLDQLSQFYLFQVARIEMLRTFKEQPSVEYFVLDRFWPSTLAYQVYGCGISNRIYDAAYDEVCRIVATIGDEIDICLTLPEELRRDRLIESGKGGDRYESKPPEFFGRVRQAYDDMVTKCWLHPVDASPDPAAIVDHIVDAYIDH